MYYSVRHVTRFFYSAPISESAMEVRMQPRREGSQHCLSFELTTDPRARITSSRDYLGNVVHHFDIPGWHTQLTITAQSLVSVAAPQLPGALPASAWGELDALAADGDCAEMLIPSQFARPTPLLRALARELNLGRREDPLSTLRTLNTVLHNALTYTPQSTRVHSPIDDALRQRQGVCQDYAHIMTALVRELGFPCRYVSGYLYRPAADDNAQADATHAWVEALLPGLGWVGFDPTNNTIAGECHIRTAIGRDYADVPPTRGVFKGQAQTELGVAVQVIPADETFADDELLLVMKRLSPPEQDGEQPEQQQQTVCVNIGCDFVYESAYPTPMMMIVRPQDSPAQRLLDERRLVEPKVPIDEYVDGFGNCVWRLVAPAGTLHLRYDAIAEVAAAPDPLLPDLPRTPVERLPGEALVYTLPSRHCQSDLFIEDAWRMFGDVPGGWQQVQAVCDWIHTNIAYGKGSTSNTSSDEVYRQRRGVCRDFAHLAVTLCRALNIPARYVCGYLPDIGVEPDPTPMDFHAWFEAYLDGAWRTFDARHNRRRSGRVLIAGGRDAVDVAFATIYGASQLTSMQVWADEAAGTSAKSSNRKERKEREEL